MFLSSVPGFDLENLFELFIDLITDQSPISMFQLLDVNYFINNPVHFLTFSDRTSGISWKINHSITLPEDFLDFLSGYPE